jgi:hypothetical protein
MAFKNYRVYILTSVAYLGSLLFGGSTLTLIDNASPNDVKAMILV